MVMKKVEYIVCTLGHNNDILTLCNQLEFPEIYPFGKRKTERIPIVRWQKDKDP